MDIHMLRHLLIAWMLLFIIGCAQSVTGIKQDKTKQNTWTKR